MKALYISYDGMLEPLGRSQVVNYIKGLSRHGIHFYLISYEKDLSFKNESEIKKIRYELNECGITWLPLRYHKKPTIPATLFDLVQGILKGGMHILKEKIPMIHARSYVAALIALVLKKILRTKFLFDMRGFWADERIDDGLWKKGVLYRTAKYFEKVFLTNADYIVVLSNRAREEIKNFPYLGHREINIEVIPTCVDVEKFVPLNTRHFGKSPGLVLLYTGSTGADSKYLTNEMLEFYKSSTEIYPDAQFMILTYPSSAGFKKILEGKNIDQRNFVVHTIPHIDMPTWIPRADAAVCFARPAYSRIGTAPTKVGEFLSCGIPIIINSGIGDTDRIVISENVGVVIEEFSSRSYREGLDRLITLMKDGGLKDRCRNVAKKYFSLENGVMKYLRIYQSLNSHGGSS